MEIQSLIARCLFHVWQYSTIYWQVILTRCLCLYNTMAPWRWQQSAAETCSSEKTTFFALFRNKPVCMRQVPDMCIMLNITFSNYYSTIINNYIFLFCSSPPGVAKVITRLASKTPAVFVDHLYTTKPVMVRTNGEPWKIEYLCSMLCIVSIDCFKRLSFV